MKLYGYWRSSATYRVRIILALKSLDYDYCPVNLLAGDQLSDAHTKRNPQGLVPALETDSGQVITQSLAIAEYLEEAYPEKPVMPDDIILRAKARAIAYAIACEAQPFMNLRMQKYLKEKRDFDADAMNDWLNRWTGGAMRAAETLVSATAGNFAVGDTPGLADAFIVPQIFGATRFGVDLSECPTLSAIAARCNELSAFKTAHPDNQPDAA